MRYMTERGQHSVGIYYPVIAVRCGKERVNVLESLVNTLCGTPYGFHVACNTTETVRPEKTDGAEMFVLRVSTRPAGDKTPCACTEPQAQTQ